MSLVAASGGWVGDTVFHSEITEFHSVEKFLCATLCELRVTLCNNSLIT